ncbi:HepT-like ribonuclease domain-containing protein [Jiella pelagia]|uniref:DUF86 domain-containing protein n=1 Tax=Jiella pelagia TaxID=2986949 RepID=A0ABY7BYB1_9HYPH|nr:HepT-like ribonuclease domain-containing protein [Jiella pelagia]WAP68115.1 DUF86 domain-containing protein [Jiella pelagia]
MIDDLIALRRWCREAEALVEGNPDALFSENRVYELALSKAMEQIGEVSRRIITKHPDFARGRVDLELEAAYGMRNRLAYGYDDVIVEIVVNAARHDVPKLRAAVEKILIDAGEDFS